MEKIKVFLKNLIYSKFPIFGRIYGALLNKKGFNTFSGWGLITTGSYPPWKNTIADNKNVHNVFKKKCG